MTEKKCLLGYTGFTGGTLLRQTEFQYLFNSKNINELNGIDCDLTVCSAAPAQKWIANAQPDKDRENLDLLKANLRNLKTRRFVLISTVDVYKETQNVNEDTTILTDNLHAYGLHRYQLEEFVKNLFDNHLIIRLPGLIGPGLKKNAIYDLKHNNEIHKVDSRGTFQFYPTVNLWRDINAFKNLRGVINLNAEPLSISEIVEECLDKEFKNEVVSMPAFYDIKSKIARSTQQSEYFYTKKESLLAMRAYFQSDLKND